MQRAVELNVAQRIKQAYLVLLFFALPQCAKQWGSFWDLSQYTGYGSGAGGGLTPATPINPCTLAPAPVSWARTQTGGVNISQFAAVAADCLGNIYAVGTINSNLTYDFGNGITVTGSVSGTWKTAVLIKYDRTGAAQWGKRVLAAGATDSEYRGVALDAAGNIYAVGTIYNNNTFDFGNGITLIPTLVSNNHVVIAKYNSLGTTLWARTTVNFPGNAFYNAVATDSGGNAYVAARLNVASIFDFGNGVTTPSGISTTSNWAVIKYNPDGTAQWANIAIAPSAGDFSFPLGITTDNSGSVFSCGVANGAVTYNFTGATMQGGNAGQNAAIAKFSATTGNASMTRSTIAGGPNTSNFNGCATDAAANVFAVGFQNMGSAFNWGSGITSTGVSSSGKNAVAVKYDNNLNPIWARSTFSGTTVTQHNAAAVDSAGNLIAAGFQEGTSLVGYGGGINATAAAGFAGAGGNALVVKYDSAGTATLAKVVTAGAAISSFSGVAVADANTLVGVGLVTNNGSFTFDPGLSITGAYALGNNLAIVKYP